MITSEVKTYRYKSGDIQRVQLVRWDDWNAISFYKPAYSQAAYEQFCNIYSNFIVPAAPAVLKKYILFHMPDELKAQYGPDGKAEERAKMILEKGVSIKDDSLHFKTPEAEKLWEMLAAKDCVRTACGKLPEVKAICVGNDAGFLSECGQSARVLANASFFIMDPFDNDTEYDKLGTPFGLAVKDGFIMSPPLFGREALTVDISGKAEVRKIELSELSISIGHVEYKPGYNAELFERPDCRRTPALREGEQDIVIIGKSVVDVVAAGRTNIPASGFVMRISGNSLVQTGDEVTYHGLEDVRFGIQVGNSVVRNGVKTEGFISKFYNIRRPWKTKYPPCLYPLDYEKARAARMAIGADEQGRPMLVWAEGAGKLHYVPGQDSCGASLTELSDICIDLGMYNGVNLDGGGSAQILLDGERKLMISDRNPDDNSSAERAVPLGLIIE